MHLWPDVLTGARGDDTRGKQLLKLTEDDRAFRSNKFRDPRYSDVSNGLMGNRPAVPRSGLPVNSHH
jgi:hypothetical protein